MIEGRVCKCGNKAMFFEPLVANSIFLYIRGIRLFFDHIIENVPAADLTVATPKPFRKWKMSSAIITKGGSIFETPFWDFAAKKCAERLEKRDRFKQLCANYAHLKSRGMMQYGPTYAFSPLTWEIVDEQMGYNSFAVPQPALATG